MTARPKPVTAADAEALEKSRQHWRAYLDGLPRLPSSWPYDWRPDGSKPCLACANRQWRQPSPGGGWCCATCHPLVKPTIAPERPAP